MPTDAMVQPGRCLKYDIMNFIRTTTSRGFSTSAWQALERAAVKRRSAATVMKLLSQFLQPIASSMAPNEGSVAAAPVMSGSRLNVLSSSPVAMTPHDGDVPFERWAALTDAYAEQFLRMQRGDKGAREKAIGLSSEMLRMNKAMEFSA